MFFHCKTIRVLLKLLPVPRPKHWAVPNIAQVSQTNFTGTITSGHRFPNPIGQGCLLQVLRLQSILICNIIYNFICWPLLHLINLLPKRRLPSWPNNINPPRGDIWWSGISLAMNSNKAGTSASVAEPNGSSCRNYYICQCCYGRHFLFREKRPTFQSRIARRFLWSASIALPFIFNCICQSFRIFKHLFLFIRNTVL